MPRRFGLSHEGRWSWAKDLLKGWAIAAILGLGAGEIIYWLLRVAPEAWWWISATIFSLIAILLTQIAPVVFLPLFFKSEQITEGVVKEQLEQMASRTGTHVRGVFRIDLSRKTRAANAALAGLGRTRRILLSDTLLDNFTPQEIAGVVAHEFGHHRHGHLWRAIAIEGVLFFIGFRVAAQVLVWSVPRLGLTSVADVAGLPLLVLLATASGLLLLPFANALSRAMERQADRFALEATGDPEAFISAMDRLARLNLAHRRPHPVIEFLFYSHPPVDKRIAMAYQWAENKNRPPKTTGNHHQTTRSADND